MGLLTVFLCFEKFDRRRLFDGGFFSGKYAMFLNAMTELFHIGGRWWWTGAMGDVCPPPDVWRSLFATRAAGRWRAFFLRLQDIDF